MIKDLTNCRFGRWVVLYRANDYICKSGYHNVMWHCKCDCGVERDVRSKSLLCGNSQSCGCLQREQLSGRASKHHGFGTRLYTIWNSMRQRCNNSNHYAFKNYGGRGIRICEEWNDYERFREWAINSGYDDNAEYGLYTLDRIDVNGNYSPTNCRFVDMKTQGGNRRNTLFMAVEGVTHSLKDWAEITGIKYDTIYKRYKKGKPIF